MVARDNRRGAIEKRRVVAVRAGFVAQQVAHLVDLHNLDAIRRRELVGVGVLRQQHGLLHELRPDGCGGICAFNLQSV